MKEVKETKEFREQFFDKTDETGRHKVVSFRTGKEYLIEPIGSLKTGFGDINPATKKVEGDYGKKYKGSIDEQDSLITKENGFKTIYRSKVGESPYGIIDGLDAKYPTIVKK